ncbi:hypothetical protein JTB14_036068 [Gonioctena quinquepunctata]|nr:hypothetical protein JTB14_036068 [Gonioctena quinquepunctata]
MAEPENWGDDDENDPDYVPPAEIENGHLTSNTEDNSDSSDDDKIQIHVIMECLTLIYPQRIRIWEN